MRIYPVATVARRWNAARSTVWRPWLQGNFHLPLAQCRTRQVRPTLSTDASMSTADFDAPRETMVRTQLERRGIHDKRVLEAMGRVSRDRFVGKQNRRQAYDDSALPIDCDQTISQPYMVALMTQAMGLSGTERVLEVGTGSGYQTAILAELAGQVVSIERHRKLSDAAGSLLDELDYQNVTLVVGDGTLGWPDAAPYDRIMVTAAGKKCPPSLFAQLVEGGTIVIPVGSREHQILQAIRKVNGTPDVSELTACRFVPLLGVDGWT
jgi:protein-L-isoaspartate(D-aspartate) O-methyltransferase